MVPLKPELYSQAKRLTTVLDQVAAEFVFQRTVLIAAGVDPIAADEDLQIDAPGAKDCQSLGMHFTSMTGSSTSCRGLRFSSFRS